MKTILILLSLALFSSCATVRPRTKWSDPSMRVLINPEGISPEAYVRLQNALTRSGRFFVVDRSLAFKAIVKEQDISRINFPTRFDDAEKFARLGKLYSVGAVVQANLQCGPVRMGWFNGYKNCLENIVVVSTVTGELIATIEVEVTGEPEDHGGLSASPEWNSAVAALLEAYPKAFEASKWTPEMIEYKKALAEEAQREREAY